MGIDISREREVSLNTDHELRLVTSIVRNPVISNKEELTVKCTYRRTKDGDHDRDGNPFIYALKRKNSYSITMKELFLFSSSFKVILKKMSAGMDVDFVVGMPSSHSVVSHFGRRVAREFGALYVGDYFSKKTVGSVLADFQLDDIPEKHKVKVKKVLSTYRKLSPTEEVSLKKVENKIRKYFEPVIANPNYAGSALTGNILLVDDLLSTGTTLLSARKAILSQEVTLGGAFCLLSDL
ncbi:hypothetical protein SAMN02745753_01850 [Marinomonas polaris DSM 16579]|uniref:Phosphoribosyl transferase domain-containing protein n=1 Tax=Marinomonas polaris DSM 16579 TaxID=1122206 RepID=A0A1M5B833_9GAMM|nr:hypothetical protein [Marinomonas polaris]SHF38342.1 hypothetical protein SAMN02745753_01850 [Marinomonas polaris DSM 16579]